MTFDDTPGLHMDLICGLLFLLSLSVSLEEEEKKKRKKTQEPKGRAVFYQVSDTVRKTDS